jgi:hypothetical protein
LRFEIVHDFDIPLDALELAVLSPSLVDRLAEKLPSIGKVSQKEHKLEGGKLERVWSYQANVKIPSFAQSYVSREMLAWDEHSTYELKTHASAWSIVPNIKPEWRKYFHASGSYELVSTPGGGTKRVVRGELDLKVPVVGQMAERMIVNEVRKTFDAEAATLHDLATLV